MDQTGSPPPSQDAGGGSTFLTQGVGTPQGNDVDRAQAGVTQTSNGTNTPPPGRPEYFPEEYWKDDRPDHEGLAKGYSTLQGRYKNLEKLLGSEKVPVPKSDEDKDAWDRWHKAAGRPDDPKGYEFAKPDKLPDGFYDDTAEQSFRDWAHNNGLNKRQAKNLHEAYVKTQLDRHTEWQNLQKQKADRLSAELIREHGAAFEGFKKGASGAMARYADPDFNKYLDESGLGNDPRLIRVFGRIGKEMMGESRLAGAPKPTGNSQDVQASITAHFKQHEKALFDKTHPEHDTRVKERQALFAQLYPEPPK